MRADSLIAELLRSGRLVVNRGTGDVFAPRSNTPAKPVGALTKKGYLRTCITVGATKVYVMVHRVVWIEVNGLPADDATQINHKDGVKTNNRPLNLEPATQQEN